MLLMYQLQSMISKLNAYVGMRFRDNYRKLRGQCIRLVLQVGMQKVIDYESCRSQ